MIMYSLLLFFHHPSSFVRLLSMLINEAQRKFCFVIFLINICSFFSSFKSYSILTNIHIDVCVCSLIVFVHSFLFLVLPSKVNGSRPKASTSTCPLLSFFLSLACVRDIFERKRVCSKRERERGEVK